MANYVYVVDDKIEGIYDQVPGNWKNVSNFYVLSDDELKEFGWYKLVKVTPEYDPQIQRIDSPLYTFEDGVAYETMQVFMLPPPPTPAPPPTEEELAYAIELQWNAVRLERDRRMNEFEWRYLRYDRQLRLELPTTDILSNMDAYMQALADITLQSDPSNIVWPEYQN